MDIVIPYIHSRNEELKFCLRSIQKHIAFNNIYIIGDAVAWLKKDSGVVQVPCENAGRSREGRIFNKLVFASGMKEVSSDFLMFNDDHFMTQDARSFPYWYDSSLEEKCAYRYYKDGYARSMANTLQFLRLMQRPTRHFDIHTPIVYNKKRILELSKDVDWDVPFGHIIKSLYCNYFKVTPEFMGDCKITSNDIDGMRRLIGCRSVFSIADSSYPQVNRLLEELYPVKSRFEI